MHGCHDVRRERGGHEFASVLGNPGLLADQYHARIFLAFSEDRLRAPLPKMASLAMR